MSGVLARLRAAGLMPRKALGQHFLHDPALLGALADEAGLGAGDVVLEIGAGPGTLTRELARRAARVIAFEADPALLAFARAELADLSNVELIELDVLRGKHRLAPELEARLLPAGRFVWVSSLPYNIATPLILLLSASRLDCASAHLLLQDELTRRLQAGPGEAAYGATSALLAYWWRERRAGRRVPAGAFWPPPRVESRVLELEARVPLGEPAEFGPYRDWVRFLFAARRKQLAPRLRRALGEEAAERALTGGALSPRARAGDLDAADFLRLARAFPLTGGREGTLKSP